MVKSANEVSSKGSTIHLTLFKRHPYGWSIFWRWRTYQICEPGVMNHIRLGMMWRWRRRRRMMIWFFVISFSMMHWLSVIRLFMVDRLWMVMLLVVHWFWIVSFGIVHWFLMISWVATILRFLIMVLRFIRVAESWSVM